MRHPANVRCGRLQRRAPGVRRVVRGGWAGNVCVQMFVSVPGCGGGGTTFELRAWMPPADVLAAGDVAQVDVTDAPEWTGPRCSDCVSPPMPGCSGGLSPGTQDVLDYLRMQFPTIYAWAGYCCRDVSDAAIPAGRMSVHGTGRALDLFVPAIRGDEVANWLVLHAQEIGIQRVLWNRSLWDAARPPGARLQPYAGSSGHESHVHVELGVAGAERRTAWFGGGV
jgi:hypothetical protein